MVKLSAVLGDSYVLAHCPVQYAAMRTQVAHDLASLEARCDKVVIVAHSQGAAIAHQVLKDGAYSKERLQAFITLGQGISKLHLLRRMDWDPQASRAAFWTRLLVTIGLLCAGLPALGILLSRWINATILELAARFPANLVLIVAGFLAIVLGVVHAIRVVGDEIEHDLLLPGAGTQFSWIDYYASADPVSNGPLTAGSVAGSPVGAPWVQDHGRDPRPCDEVYNSGSILTDHNGYLRNQDQLLSKLINNVVAVTFGDPNGDAAGPRLVHDEDLTEVKRRRHRLVAMLVGDRMLAATVGVVLWWFNPGPLLKDPMNSLVHLVAPHTGMGDRLARFIAAAILMALFYVVVVLVWRILERRSISHFFHTAKRGWQPQQAPEPSMPRDHTTQTTAATTVS